MNIVHLNQMCVFPEIYQSKTNKLFAKKKYAKYVPTFLNIN